MALRSASSFPSQKTEYYECTDSDVMAKTHYRRWLGAHLCPWAGCGLFLVGAIGPMVQPYPATDIAWLVHVTERVLNGAQLYVDIIENRPPSLFLLAMPPVWAGRLLDIEPTLTYHAWISALIATSLLLCRRISREGLFKGQPVTRQIFLLTAALLVGLVSLHHYGQPGHIVSVLLLPYLLTTAQRALGQNVRLRQAILPGLLAGIGIALKPFFVIAWLCIVLFVRTRMRDPRSVTSFENLCIAGIQILLLGGIVFGFKPYLATVLPLAIELFNAHNAPLIVLFVHSLYGGLIIGVPLTLALGKQAVPGPLYEVLIIAAGAFLVVFLIQLKGWGQHLLPSLVFTFLLCTILIVGYWERCLISGAPIHGRGLLAILLAAVLFFPIGLGVGTPIFPPTFFIRIDNPGYREALSDLSAIVHKEAAGEPIFVFSASSYPGLHLISRSRAQWPYRFWSLWPLPGLYRALDPDPGRYVYRKPENQPPFERLVFDSIVSDFLTYPPSLLIVDAGSPKNGWLHAHGDGGFDYLDYFRRDERFTNQFQNYEELPSVARFRVFRRK